MISGYRKYSFIFYHIVKTNRELSSKEQHYQIYRRISDHQILSTTTKNNNFMRFTLKTETRSETNRFLQ